MKRVGSALSSLASSSGSHIGDSPRKACRVSKSKCETVIRAMSENQFKEDVEAEIHEIVSVLRQHPELVLYCKVVRNKYFGSTETKYAGQRRCERLQTCLEYLVREC